MSRTATEHRILAAIMFTDMVGYSALAQRDEALALELLQEHRGLLRAVFPKHQGTEIKTIGDGFLVEFPSALAAVQCAVEIQQAMAARNQSQPAPRHVSIRIGIHVGDVVHRAGDVEGDGVNIAARIEPLAEPGGICISHAVHDQIENKVEQALVRLCRPELKNIQASVEVYKLVLDGTHPAPCPSTRRRSMRIAAGAMIVLALGFLLLLKFGPGPKSGVSTTNAPPNAPTAPSAAAQNSIAVLPFVNMSADKADEYLSDGMTEELLNVLSRVPGLRVPGRSSSFAFKGKTEEGIFRTVGERLHVVTVLEGSVRRDGEKLRITAQLINVADGFHLWSETYDRDMTNIFSVQSEVARQVAAALKIQLGMAEMQRLQTKPTANLAAYELYLKGRFYHYQFTDQTFKQAIDLFQQAIALDPGFAKAYAGLAATYAWVSSVYLPPAEAMPKARGYVLQALALDESLAEAHHSLATIKWWGDWDFPGAEREFKRSFELSPSEARVYWDYASFLAMLNREDEAIKAATKGEQLAPDESALRQAGIYSALRQYDKAAELARRAIRENPNTGPAHGTLAGALARQGKFAESIDEARKTLELSNAGDRGWALLDLATVLAQSGRTEEARRHLDAVNLLATQIYVSPVAMAQLHAALGERDRAFEYLQTAYESRCDDLLSLPREPVFDSLRDDPRFAELLKKVGLAK